MKTTRLGLGVLAMLACGGSLTAPLAAQQKTNPTPGSGADGGLPGSKQPNIVWIFSDDHAYQAIGAYGGRLAGLNPTPNIDRLAREGMRFDNMCVENAICAPSRATLLTGKFSHKHGWLKNSILRIFNWEQPMFPERMREAGYQTAMFGKLHISGLDPRGFDYFEVLSGDYGQGSYYDPTFITTKGKMKEKGYTTDIITDHSLDWLKSSRDPSKPFMLMIHHKAPHRTWVPAERYMSLYEDVDIPEPVDLFDDYTGRGTAAHIQKMNISRYLNSTDLKTAGKIGGDAFKARRDFWEANKKTLKGDDLTRWKYQTYMKDYLRTVRGVDDSVGEVLDYLEQNGLAENTIVMYSSDQGFYLGEHGWFDKRFMYSESLKTPFLVRWPGVIEPGSVTDELAQNIDWAPTFLDIAGAAIPSDMQGVSISPLLKGTTPADWRQSLYYHYYEDGGEHNVCRHEGVTTKDWKLIRFYGKGVPNGEEWELYDLKKDPTEHISVYGDPANAAIVAELKIELARLKTKYQVPEKDAF